MKIFLILILIGLCTYVGYGFAKYYINRALFWKEMNLLLEKLKLEINFTKEKLGLIFVSFETKSKELKKLINNFLSCLEQKIFSEEKLFEKIKILKTEEKDTIGQFFKSLGHFDVSGQTKQIEGFQKAFNSFEKQCDEEKKKYASLYVKLGIIVGALIGLILA